ncbi:hypothetical protein [Mycolicibacterium komossense]|uniref:Uncharacterized protein n=1 Tax=Mycolicibacterium komossense TaxID=1779 RepID=A0ABT3C565_9MYCO|nr:hypothetical protein [Mycolicibacterium komossense]MCV7224615.1 hypothetical protein [Mycolicibacterium komossense]
MLDTTQQIAERPDECLVRVADDDGAPTAFYWRGGQTEFAHITEISLGRLHLIGHRPGPCC